MRKRTRRFLPAISTRNEKRYFLVWKNAREDAVVNKMIVSTIAVQFFSMVTLCVGLIVDGLIVGGFLGIDSITAFGLVKPLMALFNAISVLFTVGMQTLLTKQMSMGDVGKARQTFTLACIAAAVFCTILLALGYLFIGDLAAFLGASGDSAYLQPLVVEYLAGYIPAILGNTFIFMLSGAALSVQVAVGYLFDLPGIAADTATLMVVSIMYGEENRSGLKATLRLCLRYGLLLQLAMGVIVFAFAPQLAGMFAASAQEITGQSVEVLRFYALALPLMGVNRVLMNALQGMHRVRHAALMFASDSLLCIVPIAFILAFPFGALGVWIALPLSELVVLLIFAITVRVKAGHFPRHISDFLFLPTDFGVPDVNLYECTIDSTNQLSDVVASAGAFCIGRGGDSGKVNQIAHCVEEMVDNILTWGFADGKRHSIDLRIVRKDDSFILRIRDDCAAFNPKERLEMHDPNDVGADLGIRMVYTMAKDVQYCHTLSFNNVIITI